MPYSVPDDLFAKMEDNILEEIKGETPKPLGITKKKRPVMRRLIPFALTAAAAIAALFVLDIHTPDSRQQDNMSKLSQSSRRATRLICLVCIRTTSSKNNTYY